jgi:hypothetical protein
MEDRCVRYQGRLEGHLKFSETYLDPVYFSPGPKNNRQITVLYQIPSIAMYPLTGQLPSVNYFNIQMTFQTDGCSPGQLTSLTTTSM